MAQIGELKVYTATGVQSLPIFELADFGANVYKVFKVYTPSGVGAIPLIDPGAGTADRPWFKVYSDVSGGLVLEGHSSASLAPAYTLITDFSSFSTANYDVNYSGALYSTSTAQTSISPQSLTMSSGTAATLLSTTGNSATIKADEGDVISLDVYFNSLPGSGTFNQCILYFGCDSQSNTLRLQVDPKNNTCVLAKASGGAPSTIDSSTFSSTPSGWWEVKIDWKDSTTDIICDVIDKGTGLSILTSQPTGTDGGSHSAKTGIGFYAKSNTGLFFNTYRRVT
tara:strand:+ start:2351 stop:3196 length:846 start_codon:yes stop_codon:yes gene_type:complete